ncbi:MAG: hypothetical protein PHH26_00415 [Candidatus Thermoplasmatota archaeon]|nr:hypothetical protein [Candidatus Thermoplasmatota archaeon]
MANQPSKNRGLFSGLFGGVIFLLALVGLVLGATSNGWAVQRNANAADGKVVATESPFEADDWTGDYHFINATEVTAGHDDILSTYDIAFNSTSGELSCAIADAKVLSNINHSEFDIGEFYAEMVNEGYSLQEMFDNMDTFIQVNITEITGFEDDPEDNEFTMVVKIGTYVIGTFTFTEEEVDDGDAVALCYVSDETLRKAMAAASADFDEDICGETYLTIDIYGVYLSNAGGVVSFQVPGANDDTVAQKITKMDGSGIYAYDATKLIPYRETYSILGTGWFVLLILACAIAVPGMLKDLGLVLTGKKKLDSLYSREG